MQRRKYDRLHFTAFFFFPAGLGLCCLRGLSLVVASGVYSPVVVHGLLIVVTFLVEHGLSACRLQ